MQESPEGKLEHNRKTIKSEKENNYELGIRSLFQLSQLFPETANLN